MQPLWPFYIIDMLRVNKPKLSHMTYLAPVMNDTLQRQEVALCAFIHIEGAFDKTPYISIERDAIQKIGVNHGVVNWWGYAKR